MGLWEKYGNASPGEKLIPKIPTIPKIPLSKAVEGNSRDTRDCRDKESCKQKAQAAADDAAEQERQRAAKVARIWGEFMQWVQACPGGYYQGCLTCPDYLWHGKTTFFCRKANMAIFGKDEPYVMIINDDGTGGSFTGTGSDDGKARGNLNMDLSRAREWRPKE